MSVRRLSYLIAALLLIAIGYSTARSLGLISRSGGVIVLSDAGKRPYAVIVKDHREIQRFLRTEGIVFDFVWVPGKADLEWTDEALRGALERSEGVSPQQWFDAKHVATRLPKYHREYSGFVKDRERYLICNMHVFEEPDSDPVPAGFSTIRDGGCDVIRVIFDVRSRTVVRIECNGEA